MSIIFYFAHKMLNSTMTEKFYELKKQLKC